MKILFTNKFATYIIYSRVELQWMNTINYYSYENTGEFASEIHGLKDGIKFKI